MRGFDLVGMAVGLVPLDRIITGRDLAPGDLVIGIDSNGIHSNGLTLARHAFFTQGGLIARSRRFPSSASPLGEELLRPTPIYVTEAIAIIEHVPSVKALINITGDGLLNLTRVAAKVGFEIDNLPPAPPIFGLIQRTGAVGDAEMFHVYNMGVGFCVIAAERDAPAVLSILERHGRHARALVGYRGRRQRRPAAAPEARRARQAVSRNVNSKGMDAPSSASDSIAATRFRQLPRLSTAISAVHSRLSSRGIIAPVP